MAPIKRQPPAGNPGTGRFWSIQLILSLLLLLTQVEGAGQQLKVKSGASFKSLGANVVINGKLANEGDVECSGTSTVQLTGHLQNDGTFDAGDATVTLRGTSSQTLSRQFGYWFFSSKRPQPRAEARFGLFRVRSPLLAESISLFIPPGT